MEGCIYQLCVGQMMGWLFGTILTFQIERPVFLREQAANLYAVTPYFVSKQVVEFPASILAPLVQVVMVFWVVGMIKFLETTLAVLLVSQNAIGMGFWISAMASNQQTATAIAPALTTPALMFGGLFANSDLLPVWLVWLQYLSPIYYANVAICQL